MESRQPKVALLTNHPISAPLIADLFSKRHPFRAACFSEAEVLNSEIESLGVSDRLPNLGWGVGSPVDHLEAWIREIQADLLCVFSWPRRIPQVVIDQFKLGVWNFHVGKLPEYRGPDGAFWQIVRGEARGALTVHQMDASFDTGRIFGEYEAELTGKTHGEHLKDLAGIAPIAMHDLLRAIERDAVEASLREQDRATAAYYPPAKLADTCLHWGRHTAADSVRLIKACNPLHGGAKALLGSQIVQIHSGDELSHRSDSEPGTLIRNECRELQVVCADGSILQVNVLADKNALYHGPDWLEH